MTYRIGPITAWGQPAMGIFREDGEQVAVITVIGDLADLIITLLNDPAAPLAEGRWRSDHFISEVSGRPFAWLHSTVGSVACFYDQGLCDRTAGLLNAKGHRVKLKVKPSGGQHDL